ncbi:molybdopterin cofactor-binding domain-containing protein, partial [Klenkia terrae]|uniref:molybdopterin cofactor-binding domain-containing protein n=1 Tax=Klenkia terrae TaxID=1052259 RepID=UPI0036239E26
MDQPAGNRVRRGSWLQTIDELERMVDYPAFLERQAALRAEGRFIGLGLSVFVESSGESTAMGKAHDLGGIYHDTATVKMEPNGSVTVTIGLTTQGQGHRTTMAQVVADSLGVPLEAITVRAAESTTYGWGSGTVGVAVRSSPVEQSYEHQRHPHQARCASGEHAQADPADIDLVDGAAVVLGVPG